MPTKGNVMLSGGKSQGHCFTPVVLTTKTTNVLIEGKPPGILGDQYVGPHNCGDKSHPPGTALVRHKKVLVNGQPVHLSKDKISCGDIAAGPPSKTVIIAG